MIYLMPKIIVSPAVAPTPISRVLLDDMDKQQLADFVYLLAEIDKANKARSQNDTKNQ